VLFDTHLHLVYRDRLNYPWLNDVPALNKESDFSTYIIKARKLGISGCFHMEVDVRSDQIRAETEMVKEFMLSHPNMMRGAISSCRPEEKSFPKFLDWARGETAIRGFRRLLHIEPNELSESQIFRDNVKRLSGTGLTFDLCALADQLPIASALVDHCPDVQFVLDHCGVKSRKERKSQLCVLSRSR
jgi:predicted TIM-barrel fold metal-dependent hydrolase